jgi:hypothetical protein
MEPKVTNCWCYVVDENYLLAALVSASQLKARLENTSDQVLLVCYGDENIITATAKVAADDLELELIVKPKALLGQLPMFCARFLLTQHVEIPSGSNLIYLDADTQIVGCIKELSDVVPERGSLLAVSDIMAFLVVRNDRTAKSFRNYFASIGLTHDRQLSYFNTGVLKVRAEDWALISNRCMTYINNHGWASLRFPDQDILNIVLEGNQNLISFKWNYPGFFIGKNLDEIVEPRIIHFMSRPRPWDGPFSPWGKTAYDPYPAFVKLYPGLNSLLKPSAGKKKIKYNLQQLVKSLVEPWGGRDFYSYLKKSEKSTILKL